MRKNVPLPRSELDGYERRSGEETVYSYSSALSLHTGRLPVEHFEESQADRLLLGGNKNNTSTLSMN